MYSPLSVLACSTCANAFKHAGKDAAGWAIAFMLVIIVSLAVGAIWYLVRLMKREKAGLDSQYCDDYIAPTTAQSASN